MSASLIGLTLKEKNPQGDYFEESRIAGSSLHSRRLWRLTGLKFSNYPGIQEAFLMEKTNLETQHSELQYLLPVSQLSTGSLKNLSREFCYTGIPKPEHSEQKLTSFLRTESDTNPLQGLKLMLFCSNLPAMLYGLLPLIPTGITNQCLFGFNFSKIIPNTTHYK